MVNEYTLTDKRVVVTGGTGSIGKILVRRLLSGEMGQPRKIIVFSRDEAKQHAMRMEYMHHRFDTYEVLYRNFERLLEFRIGDIRNFESVSDVLRDADVVLNTAALKQVPTCEYFPFEAVKTNILGAENIVRAIREHDLLVETVVGISTDKACKPVNVMGMTKAIQERIFMRANIDCPHTRFICVRYGNVLASNGSVIPLFQEQIKNGGPITITTPGMTRFLLAPDAAVDIVFTALRQANRGETYIPRMPSAKISDIVAAMIGERRIQTVVTGIRPGEKLDETLVSEEEANRTVVRGSCYVILPILPELCSNIGPECVSRTLSYEYSSAADQMSREEVKTLLQQNGLLMQD